MKQKPLIDEDGVPSGDDGQQNEGASSSLRIPLAL